MIKKALYTWVCRDGTEFSCDCQVDTEYREAFNLIALPPEGSIKEEFVTIDGKKYYICNYKYICKYKEETL